MSEPPTIPLEAHGLRKSFRLGDGSELHVLEGVDLRVEEGETIAIIGASGAGKSTLLHILGTLDRPSAGEVKLGGRSLATIDEESLADLRNRHVGFVFQFHHLLREFTALENVMMPGLIAGTEEKEVRMKAVEVLEAVALEERMAHRPWQLSGGEQQRVALARALANDPLILLADEPTGNLDENRSERLHDLLFRLQADRGLAMVLVTHNRELAERTHRTLVLTDGRLHPTGTMTGPPDEM